MRMIIDELTAAVSGEPWHGDSIQALLRDVTPDLASTRPIRAAHSIWEIVRHLTAWTQEVTRRLAGHPPGLPEIGDWPAPTGGDAAAWRRDVQALFDAHDRLVTAIGAMTPEQLTAPPPDAKRRDVGSGATREVMLHGLAQHHAYHGGQIGVLKKARTATAGDR